MHQERLPKQVLLAKVKGKRPVRRPQTCWEDYIEDLGLNQLGLQPNEILEVVANRDVWRQTVMCTNSQLVEFCSLPSIKDSSIPLIALPKDTTSELRLISKLSL